MAGEAEFDAQGTDVTKCGYRLVHLWVKYTVKGSNEGLPVSLRDSYLQSRCQLCPEHKESIILDSPISDHFSFDHLIVVYSVPVRTAVERDKKGVQIPELTLGNLHPGHLVSFDACSTRA